MARVRIWKFVLAWAIVAAVGPGSVSAQIAFERTYGGTEMDQGFSVQETEDGGYIVTGSTSSFDCLGKDVYLIKTDSLGDTLWTRTYGGPCGSDEGRSVQQTSDGGYIVAGYIYVSPTNPEVWLLKTDSSGDTLWTKIYGGSDGEWGYSVQQTEDGGYVITGKTSSFGAGQSDVWLIKADSSGDTLWTRTCGDSSQEVGHSVQQTRDGGYIIAGYVWPFGAPWPAYDVYLIKTDAWGDTLWTRVYGGPQEDYASSVRQTEDGGYIIAGYAESFGAGGYDVWLIRTDWSGDTLWTRTYGGTEDDIGCSVEQTTDGGYILTGDTWSFGAGQSDVWLIKTDPSGDTLYTRTCGGTGRDRGRSVQQTRDGGYIIAGSTDSYGAGELDFYLIKIGPSGLVTGGGWIPARSDGSGEKGTFGFNAHSEGGQVWGQLQFNEHGNGMNVHSDTIETLVLQPGDTIANFSGECRVDRISGYSFECEVEDRGEPGHGVDKFSIDICDGQGNLYYSAGGVLGGGNIQIRKGDDGIAKGGSDPGAEPGDDPNPPPSTQGEAFVPLAGKGLLQNSPNPFCRATTIRYSVPGRRGDTGTRRQGDVSTYQHINLSVYDIAGRLVRTLVNRTQTAGHYAVDWDGKDSSGRKVATGIYIYQLTGRDTEGPPETRRTSRQADDFSRTEKMVILR